MRWLLAALLGAAVALSAQRSVAGEMVAHAFESRTLGRIWNISVYLPEGYAGGMRYPVVYLLPGNSARRGEWVNLELPRLADARISAGLMPPALIVVPELGTSWGVDRRERMQTAVADDLLAEVERRWHTLPGRQGRAIVGISAGAFAALRQAMLHPDRFAALAVMSPAIYVPEPPPQSAARSVGTFAAEADGTFDPALWRSLNYPALMPGFVASGVTMPAFIGSGDADHLGTQNQARRLYETWQGLGMPAELRLVPGGHTYAVWRALLPDALSWALRFTSAASR